MALSTPIAQQKVAFDATQASIFYFTSSGGSQVVKNRITIRRQSDNVVVYQNTDMTFLLQQTVPANTLTNNTYYNFYFNTYDVDDNISSNSNVVAFYCYAQPTITFTNAPVTNIIDSSSYTFNITYSQSNGELLDYLICYLYDAQNNEISNSGKLYSVATPPINFTYTFSGFENNTIYKTQCRAVSVNGTISESEVYTFTAQYYYPNVFSLITLENKCDDGYVQIQSNVILSEGYVEPDSEYFMSDIMDGNKANYIMWDEWFTTLTDDLISVWAETYAVDISGTKTLTFDDGFSVPSGFQFQLWMNPVADGDIAYLYKVGNESNRMILSIKSGIPSGESTVKNWIEIRTEDGSLFDFTNYVDAMKVDTKFTIWLKKVGTVYTFTLEVITVGTGSTVSWIGTSPYPTTETHNDIESLFPFDTLILRNGKYDNLDITSQTDRAYSTSYPTWNYYTRLNCDFSTLNGGNINAVLSQLESIRIKRRKYGSFDWVQLYEIPITDANDLNIVKGDCGVPTGEIFEYAIVPVGGGAEGDYIISEITTNFRWCYLCDGDNILKFYSNVSYPTITSNPSGGILAPIGRAKPITIYNADSDYESGTFSGNVLGADFLTTRVIDRKEVTKQVATYKQFINNKKPKFLKDWNGRIKIVDTNVLSGTTETVDLISGKAILSFAWVDKGDYDNQSQLEENGLV